MEAAKLKHLKMSGETGILADRIIENWLLGLRKTNPAILDMFRDRDVKPYRDLLPWSGEFAGKYITGAYYMYRLTGSRALYEEIVEFIAELLQYQAEDGYLGCFSRQCRLTGAFSATPEKTGETWDAWGHYHIMFGLLLWYDLTGNDSYFRAVEKMAALFLRRFYGDGPRLSSTGSTEMNLSVYHVFAILYNRTGERKYLDFAKAIEEDLSADNAGDYMHCALKGIAFYQCPKPRWESLHVIMGFAEMYRCTGEARYLDAARQIFLSILETDVHNTGAFSTDEQAIGHPYKNSNIETCCVVAYNALAIEIFRLTGDPQISDFLERSHYNAILGCNNPSGRWATYNTPMDGVKCASYHSVGFQCRPGSPDLNCCSVNAPRGTANLVDWMVTEQDGALYLNFYEDMSFETADGIRVQISGDYPASGSVSVRISSDGAERTVGLRIPAWSGKTAVILNGRRCAAEPGSYWTCTKVWDDTVCLELDLTPYTEAGDLDYRGMSSVYAGPILFGMENGENPAVDFERMPALSRAGLSALRPRRMADGSITLQTEEGILLRDFYHLGVSGGFYRTWLNTKD